MEWGLGGKKKKDKLELFDLQNQDKQKQWRKLKSLLLVTGYHLASINPLEVEKAFQVLNGTRVTSPYVEISAFTNSHTISFNYLQRWQQQLSLPSNHSPII